MRVAALLNESRRSFFEKMTRLRLNELPFLRLASLHGVLKCHKRPLIWDKVLSCCEPRYCTNRKTRIPPPLSCFPFLSRPPLDGVIRYWPSGLKATDPQPNIDT